MLDAGCGSGRTLEELVRLRGGAGIELDPVAAELARARGRGEVRIGRLEELPWEDAQFDLITCLDVIEHTPDDRVTLSELRRVSKPGGVPARDRAGLPGSVVDCTTWPTITTAATRGARLRAAARRGRLAACAR